MTNVFFCEIKSMLMRMKFSINVSILFLVMLLFKRLHYVEWFYLFNKMTNKSIFNVLNFFCNIKAATTLRGSDFCNVSKLGILWKNGALCFIIYRSSLLILIFPAGYTNQHIFFLVWSSSQTGQVPSIRTTANRKAHCLVNIAGVWSRNRCILP